MPHCDLKAKNKHVLKRSHLCQAALANREKPLALLLRLESTIWVCWFCWHEFSWGEAEVISLFSAGPQGKADHILTAPGTGNQTGAVSSMARLDPQLALPRAVIIDHSLYGCSVFLVWGYRGLGWISHQISACCSWTKHWSNSSSVPRCIFKKMILGGVWVADLSELVKDNVFGSCLSRHPYV